MDPNADCGIAYLIVASMEARKAIPCENPRIPPVIIKKLLALILRISHSKYQLPAKTFNFEISLLFFLKFEKVM
jgi:hypothetical protein